MAAVTSYAGQTLAGLEGWLLWAVVPVTLLPWVALLSREIPFTFRQCKWLAVFYVLVLSEANHMLGHVAQMVQFHVLHLDGAHATESSRPRHRVGPHPLEHLDSCGGAEQKPGRSNSVGQILGWQRRRWSLATVPLGKLAGAGLDRRGPSASGFVGTSLAVTVRTTGSARNTQPGASGDGWFLGSTAG